MQSALIYTGIVVVMFLLVISIRYKNNLLIKLVLKTIMGAVLIYAFNWGCGYLEKYINADITVPLNIFTAMCVGILQLPGVALIFIIKYIILV